MAFVIFLSFTRKKLFLDFEDVAADQSIATTSNAEVGSSELIAIADKSKTELGNPIATENS